MNLFKRLSRHFFLLAILFAMPLTGCQTSTPTVEPTWETFSKQECAYEFQYPAAARVELVEGAASPVRVHLGTGEPFQIACTRDYGPADALYYLDTASRGQRDIGENTWSEYVLPDGYGDAVGRTPPLYGLQMESGKVLYTVTFTSQETMTELQESILSTFRILSNP